MQTMELHKSSYELLGSSHDYGRSDLESQCFTPPCTMFLTTSWLAFNFGLSEETCFGQGNYMEVTTYSSEHSPKEVMCCCHLHEERFLVPLDEFT